MQYVYYGMCDDPSRIKQYLTVCSVPPTQTCHTHPPRRERGDDVGYCDGILTMSASVPPGHTPFSWTGGLDAGAVPPGHTPFSWTGGVAEPVSTATQAAPSSGFVPKINASAAARLGPVLKRPPPTTISREKLATFVVNPKALDDHMAVNSYVEGPTPTMKDISVFAALCPAPTLPHAVRWYKHMTPLYARIHASDDELNAKLFALPGVFEDLYGIAGTPRSGTHNGAPKDSTAGAEVEDPSTKEAVIALLAKKIPKRYTTSTHEAVRTSEEAAEVRGATLASGAKAMLLSVRGARDANEFVLVVISAAAKMDSKALKKVGSFKSTRFASEDEVKQVTGCLPGAVPPLGSIWGLRTFMDDSLQSQGETINFNAGLRTFSVSMKLVDYLAVEGPTVCSIRG